MQKKDVMIDLKEMLFYIAKRWRQGLVWVLVFAVIFSMVGFVKKKNANVESAPITVYEYYSTAVATKRGELAEKAALEVERIYQAYNEYEVKYQDLLEYSNASPYMKLDANNVAVCDVSFALAGNENSSASSLMEQCKAILQESKVTNALAEELGVEAYYASDMICVNSVETEAERANITLSLRIYLLDEAQGAQAASIVKSALTEVGGVSLISQDVTITSDQKLSLNQKDVMKQLSTVASEMVNMKSGMIDKQVSYFDAYYALNEFLAKVEAGEADITDVKSYAVAETVSMKKYLALGVLGGAVLFVLWGMFVYLITGKMRCAYDFKLLFELPSIGAPVVMKGDQKELLLDKLFRKLFAKGNVDSLEQQVTKICAEILAEIKDTDTNKVILCSSSSNAELAELRTMLTEELAKTVNTVEFKNINGKEKNFFDELASGDSVVLVEKCFDTRYNQLERLIDICDKYDTYILGGVVIE